MTVGADEDSTDALEQVAYLSRSDNRVAILDGLARGPRTRRRLAEETGVSRTTLDRIVNELEDRGWAERTPDGEYAATETGRRLIGEFRPMVEAVEAIESLGDALSWLPADLDVDLGRFSDATVRRPGPRGPTETVDYIVDLVEDADEVGILSHMVPPVPFARALRDRVVAGELTTTLVATRECVDYLAADPDRLARWRDVIESGEDLWCYDGHIPCNVFVFDGTVLIKQSEPGPVEESFGAPIECHDDAVRAWATDLVASHRAEAVRVDAGAVAASPDAGSDDR